MYLAYGLLIFFVEIEIEQLLVGIEFQFLPLFFLLLLQLDLRLIGIWVRLSLDIIQ